MNTTPDRPVYRNDTKDIVILELRLQPGDEIAVSATLASSTVGLLDVLRPAASTAKEEAMRQRLEIAAAAEAEEAERLAREGDQRKQSEKDAAKVLRDAVAAQAAAEKEAAIARAEGVEREAAARQAIIDARLAAAAAADAAASGATSGAPASAPAVADEADRSVRTDVPGAPTAPDAEAAAKAEAAKVRSEKRKAAAAAKKAAPAKKAAASK